MGAETISIYLHRFEEAAQRLLPGSTRRPERLHSATQYSLAAGGKRLRPLLVMAAADLGEDPVDAAPAAVAVECLHTYSLIHDDLPAIDNSDMRRGRPSCHKQFDEATAILAGDALLTDAFRILGQAYSDDPALGLRLVATLGSAASSEALIGGQMEDILNEGKPLTQEGLDYIHLNKTAALLTACLEMGLLHTNPSEDQLRRIRRVGQAIGLGFQIVDDILDATSTAEQLGKSTGRDAELSKTTYVTLHGIDASRARVAELTQDALDALAPWGGKAEFLSGIIRDLEHRAK